GASEHVHRPFSTAIQLREASDSAWMLGTARTEEPFPVGLTPAFWRELRPTRRPAVEIAPDETGTRVELRAGCCWLGGRRRPPSYGRERPKASESPPSYNPFRLSAALRNVGSGFCSVHTVLEL